MPPRLVPKPEPSTESTSTFEEHNPHQWDYAGTTLSMTRNVIIDDQTTNSNHISPNSQMGCNKQRNSVLNSPFN